ncbi:CHAT domain-containing protein [Sphingomonas sp. R647]|uniref:CHAT domain-containing protein n=1 Tax=Sphingomonas sp. R647 TaxID=2875233 RepID=UPI001CD5C1F4|nr:CHAT domain-containing protein [Sphingomonas sp. R647]MCA1197776.1 CHAT domain-containing protein [Sphingomonas sp. R647]
MAQHLLIYFDEAPCCGNCGRPLPVDSLVQVTFVDGLRDVPPEIRNGNINKIACSNCTNDAWLWVGYLCLDLQRNRSVLAVANVNAASNDYWLEQSLNRARTERPELDWAAMTLPPVSVEDYRSVIEVLTWDDETYAAQASIDRCFLVRRDMVDPELRARQWVEDYVALSCNRLVGIEQSSVPFLMALVRVAKAYAESAEQSEISPEAIESLLAYIAEFIAECNAGGPPDDFEMHQTVDDVGPYKPFLFNLSVACEQHLAHLARQSVSQETLDRIEVVADALGTLLAPSQTVPNFGDVSEADRLLHLAQERAVVVANLPEGRFADFDGSPLTLQHVVDLAATGNRPWQIALCYPVKEHRDRRMYTPDDQAVLELLVAIAVRFGDFEARLGAHWVLATLFHDSNAFRDGAIVAAKLLNRLFSMRDVGEFRASVGSIPFLASLFDVVGSHCRHARSFALSQQFAAVAVEQFNVAGSREDALRIRTEMLITASTFTTVSDSEIDDLVADIRGTELPPKVFSDLLGKTLSLRARLAAERHPVAPLILAVFHKLLPPPSREGPGGQFSAYLGTPEELLEEVGASALLEPNFQIEDYDKDKGAKSSASELVETLQAGGLLCLDKLKGDGAARLVVSGNSYLVHFAAALDHAAEHAHWQLWLNLFVEMVGATDKLHPDLALHLISIAESAATDLNIRDIPERTRSFAMLKARAHCHKFLRSQDDSKELDEARVAFKQAIDAACLVIPPSDDLSLRIAEFREISGDCVGASDAYVSLALALERQARDHQGSLPDDRLEQRARAYSRAAAARLFAAISPKGPPDQEMLTQVLGLIELSRTQVRSNAPLSDHGVEAALALLPARPSAILADLPGRKGVLVYELFPDSDFKAGFWACIYCAPDGEISFHLMPLEETYQSIKTVADVFEATSGALIGQTIGSAARTFAQVAGASSGVLEILGDELVGHKIAAAISRDRLDRLFIAPQAYLYEVPWMALRVSKPGPALLIALGRTEGAMGINLVHTISSLRASSAPVRTPADVASGGAAFLLAARPAWRPELHPIYGARARMERTAAMLEGAGIAVQRELSATVDNILRALHRRDVSFVFCHGMVDEGGIALIAEDGRLGVPEIAARSRSSRFTGGVVVLSACSGLALDASSAFRKREVRGVPVKLVEAGVRYVAGSSRPLQSVIGVRLMEWMATACQSGEALDQALSRLCLSLSADPYLSAPQYWGYLAGFGDGGTIMSTSGVPTNEQ